jgi:cytochrome c553
MKQLLVAATASALVLACAASAPANDADVPPPWAYGFTTPVPPGTPQAPPNPAQVLDNVTLYTVEGSSRSFARAQISDRYGPADWFPEDHPAMPEIVARGRQSAQSPIYACSLCHYPNGRGRPENANITGLTYEYFVQQMISAMAPARRRIRASPTLA